LIGAAAGPDAPLRRGAAFGDGASGRSDASHYYKQGRTNVSFTSEFKEFAMRGNVIDLAVGVVIGGAFGKIVSSLVASIIMPIVGLLTSGNDFSKLAVAIGTNAKGEPILITYGAFIQSVVDFVIIAIVIFLAIRAINKLKKPPPPPAAPTTPREEVLLTEIRDLLARRT
jgi:large conductance mechanosensitive channel